MRGVGSVWWRPNQGARRPVARSTDAITRAVENVQQSTEMAASALDGVTTRVQEMDNGQRHRRRVDGRRMDGGDTGLVRMAEMLQGEVSGFVDQVRRG